MRRPDHPWSAGDRRCCWEARTASGTDPRHRGAAFRRPSSLRGVPSLHHPVRRAWSSPPSSPSRSSRPACSRAWRRPPPRGVRRAARPPPGVDHRLDEQTGHDARDDEHHVHTTPLLLLCPSSVLPAGPVFATGSPELDALLPTLPAVLFEGGAQVHFGYNPVDCCHAGGYNPEPNEVWVSELALRSTAELTYVTVHELAHSVHLDSARGPALTAAVAGAPVVRAGSPWDDSEKVADCVAWALFPAETAAAGISYWDCPDPWRSQVLAAIRMIASAGDAVPVLRPQARGAPPVASRRGPPRPSRRPSARAAPVTSRSCTARAARSRLRTAARRSARRAHRRGRSAPGRRGRAWSSRATRGTSPPAAGTRSPAPRCAAGRPADDGCRRGRRRAPAASRREAR